MLMPMFLLCTALFSTPSLTCSARNQKTEFLCHFGPKIKTFNDDQILSSDLQGKTVPGPRCAHGRQWGLLPGCEPGYLPFEEQRATYSHTMTYTYRITIYPDSQQAVVLNTHYLASCPPCQAQVIKWGWRDKELLV